MFLTDHQKPAIILPDQTISYHQLLLIISAMERVLEVSKKARVIIFSENRIEWIAAFYAAWNKGATVVPVDFMSTANELQYITQDCTPEVIFCSAQVHETVSEMAGQLNFTPRIIVFEELEQTSPFDTAAEITCPDPEQTALLIYTSGTTGTPKGVMLSFTNILANINAVTKGIPIYSTDERVLMLLPLHHIFPLLGTMVAPLYIGATIAMCPSLKSEDIIKTLQDNGVTIVIGVPRLYKLISTAIMAKIKANKVASLLYRLAEKIQNRTLSRLLFGSVHRKFGGRLKYLVSGGAALDPVVGKQFTTLGFEVLEGYGMTEAAPMITFTRPGQVLIGSAGNNLPGTIIDIRDEEIVAKGKNIMQGYWNKPEATAEAVRDGWLYTGDLGRLDEHGNLFITGRKKEILVMSNGKNINPALLESKLEDMTDAVSEVGIFVDNDTLQAIIRPNLGAIRERGIADIEGYFRTQILDQFNRSVSPAYRLMKFTLVDEELPKTRLSKLQRFKLPQMAASLSKKKESVEHPTIKEYTIIKEYLESITSRSISPDDHFEIDIALDSLDKISLLVFIKNTFGIELNEPRLMEHQTPARLAAYVHDNKERIQIETFNWQQIIREKIDLPLPRTWATTVLLKNLSRTLLSLYFSIRAEGQEHMPKTPCIIAPNHQSFFDGLFVASWLSNPVMRKTYFYAKEKHLRNKWVRRFADRHNVVVIDIQSDVKASIQKTAALLKSGKNIMIFPEGTRTRDGRLGDFKKTFAILSKELNVPVVPVAISGAFHALPSGKFIPKPFSKISVHFQKPVFPEHHSYESLMEQVFSTIQACLPETSTSNS